jgi:hypothetical protein
MSKTIKFKAIDEHGFNTQIKPFPSSTIIPEWWKTMTPYMKSNENINGKELLIKNGSSNVTFKKCTPMLDALTSGYIISLWSDVRVYIENDMPQLSWKTNFPVFTPHGGESDKIDPPSGYTNYVAKYQNTWIPITPPGYSVLAISPFGYKNLPFYAVPAIIDSDKSILEMLNPMWIKKDFEGIVEKGTPLVQLIPFKRDDWKAEYEFYKNNEHNTLKEKTFNSNIVNHYIRNHWSKKSFK